jgi:hypothetical protein
MNAALSFTLPRSNPLHYLLNPFNLLLLVPVLVDMTMPFLTWRGPLPDQLDYLSHAAIAGIIVLVVARMLAFNHVPGVVFLIVWVTLAGVSMSMLRGQAMAGTIWGWWLLFQFPMVGLYAYLNPYWPERFAPLFHKCYIYLLIGQLILQIGQYATGEPPGDHLAGIFGHYGSTGLAVFISLILCFAFGRWLAYGDWKTLVFTLLMTNAISVLAELKLFMIVTMILSGLGLLAFTIKTGSIMKVIPYVAVIFVLLGVFVQFYNTVVAGEDGTRLEEYLDPEKVDGYLNIQNQQVRDGRYYIEVGRNLALEIGWKTINRDIPTLLFGFGIGARSASASLGVVGSALSQGDLGLNAGTSLLVLMQENGVVGLGVLAAFAAWAVFTMLQHTLRYPDSDANDLRYGLIMFSILWPLWLWYGLTWNFRLPMEVYWITLGYVMYEARVRSHPEAGDIHKLAARSVMKGPR